MLRGHFGLRFGATCNDTRGPLNTPCMVSSARALEGGQCYALTVFLKSSYWRSMVSSVGNGEDVWGPLKRWGPVGGFWVLRMLSPPSSLLWLSVWS